MATEVIQFEQPKAAPEDEVLIQTGRVVETFELSSLIPPEQAVDLPRMIPDVVLLGSLGDGRLRVVSPIRVKVTAENEHFVLHAMDLDEFGYGNNLSEATTDLQRTIVELFFSLEADRERLGSDLRRTLATLEQIIRKVGR